MTDLPLDPITDEVQVVKVRPEPSKATKLAKLFLALAILIGTMGIVFYAHDSYDTAKDSRELSKFNAGQGACRARYAAAVQVAEARALASLAVDSLSSQFSARVLAYEDAADAYQRNVLNCKLPANPKP